MTTHEPSHFMFKHGVRYDNMQLLNHTHTHGYDVMMVMIPYCYVPGSYMIETFAIIAFLPICMTIMSGLYAFYTKNVQSFLLLFFVYILWIISYCTQELIASERPHPECIPFMFYEHALPAPEIVYIVSNVTFVACCIFLFSKSAFSWIQALFFLFLLALYPYVHYVGLMCTAMQAFLSFLFGFIPTVLFAWLLYVAGNAGLFDIISKETLIDIWDSLESSNYKQPQTDHGDQDIESYGVSSHISANPSIRKRISQQ